MHSAHGSIRRFEPASFKPSQTAGRSRRPELQAVQPATASVVRSLWRYPSLAVPPVLEATDHGRIDQASVVGAVSSTDALDFLEHPFRLSQFEHLLSERSQPSCDEPIGLAAGDAASLQSEGRFHPRQLETTRLHFSPWRP